MKNLEKGDTELKMESNMAKRYIERCLTSVAIGEMQINTTLKDYWLNICN